MARVHAMTFCSVITASSCCCFLILSSFHGRLLQVALPMCSISGSWLEDPLERNVVFAVLNRLYLSQLHLTRFLKYCVPVPFLTHLQHLLCVSEFRMLKEALQVNVLLGRRSDWEFFVVYLVMGHFVGLCSGGWTPGEKEMQYSLKGHRYFAISSCWFRVLRHPWVVRISQTMSHVVQEGEIIELWKTTHAPAAGWGPVPYWGPPDGWQVNFGWFGEQRRLTLSPSQLMWWQNEACPVGVVPSWAVVICCRASHGLQPREHHCLSDDCIHCCLWEQVWKASLPANPCHFRAIPALPVPGLFWHSHWGVHTHIDRCLGKVPWRWVFLEQTASV